MGISDSQEIGGQNGTVSILQDETNLEEIINKYEQQISSISSNLKKKEVRTYHMLLEDVTYQKKLFKFKFTDIAELSEMPISTVKRIFYGVSIPRITTFLKILDAIGLTIKIVKK